MTSQFFAKPWIHGGPGFVFYICWGCRNVEFPDLRVSKTKNGHLVGLILLCCHVMYIFTFFHQAGVMPTELPNHLQLFQLCGELAFDHFVRSLGL